MTTLPGTLTPDRPVPYALTPKAHAALGSDPGPAGAFPPVVCLCGSTRFYEQFQQANYDLTMRGEIVLSVGFYPHAKALHGHGEGIGHDSAEKIALDDLHKRKIDLADYVLVLNVGGYIGQSTRSEIAYARATGKPVRYLDPEAVDGRGSADEWACEVCGAGWFGPRPGDGLCADCRGNG